MTIPKLAVGLIVKNGKEFIKDWITSAEKIADVILVVDNGADKEVWETLAFHPQVKRYYIQKGMERNQSRDYQIILDMAREENCDWVWNVDIDEVIPYFDNQYFKFFLLNQTSESIAFPLFEMRNDNNHYVRVKENDGTLKEGRLVHKCYKVLSHFEFNEKDAHGVSIPHNCPRCKTFLSIPIQHFGHMTKELRDEKRKKVGNIKDDDEQETTWMEEDESKIEIKDFNELINTSVFLKDQWKTINTQQ